MNHAAKKLAYLAAVLLGTLLTMPAKSASQDIDKTFSVDAGGTLTLESDEGSIRVDTWNKNEVKITVEKSARNQERLNEFSVNFDQKGNNILVEGEGEWNNRVSVKFIITVPEQFNLDLKTGGGSIGVKDISGDVKVNTSGGSIKIGNVSEGNVDAHTSGGSIKVGDVDGNLKVNTSGGSIRLGKVKGTSSIDTSGGSIGLEQGGNDVTAETSGGSIKIGPVNGKVDVDTSGGSIRIGMAESDVKAETSGGSIKVEGSKGKVNVDTSGGGIYVGSSGGPVIAETNGGSIKVLQARGYIEASTNGGRIEAEMIADDNSLDTHIDLHSNGGTLELRIPKSLAGSVSASLKITRNARRDYRIYSDFPLTIKGENSNRISARGDINGGGDKINLTTTNGDIHIKMIDD